MARYIDADAFFADFAEIRDYEYASQEYEVDVVEVVRCKECKFYETNQDECVFYNAQWVKHEDDFCPYGERREDDGREDDAERTEEDKT